MSTSMALDQPPPPKLDLDTFISTALSSTPTILHPFFEEFRTLYTRKLWHQLTLRLFAFYEHPQSVPFRVDVFERFVRVFEARLNQLSLVQIAVKTSKEIENPKKNIEFLTNLLARITPGEDTPATLTGKEASVLLQSTLAHTSLLFGDLAGCSKNMESAKTLLDTLEGCDNSVRAAYFGVAADYYKFKAEYGPYYRNSLLYLACVDPEKDMTHTERLQRAHDLSLAALLSDSIYNFGELLVHPILSVLDPPHSTSPTTPSSPGAISAAEHAWLKKLLYTFNSGSIGKFEALSPILPKEPILMQNYPFLRQKICLMALIESVFKNANEGGSGDGVTGTEGNGRIMTFQKISEETRLPLDEVEHLVMKALSLKLIRGSLDQVDRAAHITWVQPRALSRTQIGGLAKRLERWVQKLQTVEKSVGDSNTGVVH